MNKIIMILVAVEILMCHQSISQEWAHEGAEWYYDYGIFYYVGYIKITYEGDTVINDQHCKILTKTRITKDLTTYQYDTVFLGNEYTWSDGDKVYIYRHEQFYTLYDFAAQPGDWWIIPETYYTNSCDTIGRIQVDSISSIVINNSTLRVLYCSEYENSHWSLGPKIIEKIGSVYSYMLPEVNTNCGIADLFEGGALRCYSDNDFGLYSTGIASECDYIVSVEKDEVPEKSFEVIPNPSDNYITFISKLFIPDNIEVFDIFGRSQKKINIKNERELIDISGLSKGVYFILINYKKKNFSYKFIKN
ncbi:MAG: T9SS type A sorting domain-containing protein [Bacteroidetes bacterium]|nr:T9SS type A sorting domain-containing protein [Bacteroidota bacterium]MBL7103739.1 T9SS type A sorting domain-containing protein [Bacteroidales bacterium]